MTLPDVICTVACHLPTVLEEPVQFSSCGAAIPSGETPANTTAS